MMPRRTWWMKRHDTVAIRPTAVVLLFIPWTTSFR